MKTTAVPSQEILSNTQLIDYFISQVIFGCMKVLFIFHYWTVEKHCSKQPIINVLPYLQKIHFGMKTGYCPNITDH